MAQAATAREDPRADWLIRPVPPLAENACGSPNPQDSGLNWPRSRRVSGPGTELRLPMNLEDLTRHSAVRGSCPTGRHRRQRAVAGFRRPRRDVRDAGRQARETAMNRFIERRLEGGQTGRGPRSFETQLVATRNSKVAGATRMTEDDSMGLCRHRSPRKFTQSQNRLSPRL